MKKTKSIVLFALRHFYLVGLLVFPRPGFAIDLAEIESLIRSGANQLALQILDRHQPDVSKQPDAWMQFEQKRFELYRQSRNWDALIERASQVPISLPAAFIRWSRIQKARAHIEKREGKKALADLRSLIWNLEKLAGKEKPAEQLAQWRQLVIQAYLSYGQVRDAEIAMLRYQQDYGNSGLQWKLLRARVLIRANRSREAYELLARNKSAEARSLYYLAQLRSRDVRPQIIYARTVALAKRKKLSEKARRELWQIAAMAAVQVRDYKAAIRMTRNALMVADQHGFPSGKDELFRLSGKQLWKRYQEYGTELANQMQLLVGADQVWFARAKKLVGKRSMRAAALFSVLARRSTSLQTRQLAHEQFSNLILKMKKKGKIYIRHLYDVKKDPALLNEIPVSLRHRLTDEALSRSDIKLASRLMGDLTEPPKGVDALFWKMRRARILIMGGKQEEGIKATYAILKDEPYIKRAQMERLMQVIFDVQAVNRHEDAIAMFRRIPLQYYDGQFRREVLYWIGDSLKALNRNVEAARHYLRSATLLNSNAMDPWAQTARFHAAGALASAGLKEDARQIYKALLRVTRESGRRVLIRNKLQQLWLKPRETTAVAPRTN